MNRKENLDRSRRLKLQMQLDLILVRNRNPRPLRADEMIVQMSRDEYQTLLELACEAMRNRRGNNHTAANSGGIPRTKRETHVK